MRSFKKTPSRVRATPPCDIEILLDIRAELPDSFKQKCCVHVQLTQAKIACADVMYNEIELQLH